LEQRAGRICIHFLIHFHGGGKLKLKEPTKNARDLSLYRYCWTGAHETRFGFECR
jgi:hypothetical protein